MFLFISILLCALSNVSCLICYCAGHCPFGQPNGSCFARPSSQCFSAVEQVYNPDTGLLEYERTYGCLPPDESGLMQCKGYLVPHQIPKSIACCSKEDWCNKELKPIAVLRTTTPSPIYRGELMSYTGPYHLATFGASVSVITLILIVVIACIVIRIRNEKMNHRCSDVEKSMPKGKKCPDDDSRTALVDSSGSGSGLRGLIQLTIGKQIEMVESIGRGHFGEVWKARLRDEWVAVKVFFTSEEASWSREIDIYKTVLLRHENILGFVSADIRGTGSWTQMVLITDYLEQGSLYDYLKVRMLDVSAMLKLAHSAACGLSHLHTEVSGKQGKPAIAHRDIKSRNILVKKDGSCVIADFGLAVKFYSNTEELDVASNSRVGTRRYMAPEVLDETIDTSKFEAYKNADMYSFGLVLWEITRRCIVDGMVEDYQLPYYDCVPTNPSFEDMKKVVCVDQTRPVVPKYWNHCEPSYFPHCVGKIMMECWRHTAGARINALKVKKTLSKLRKEVRDDVKLV